MTSRLPSSPQEREHPLYEVISLIGTDDPYLYASVETHSKRMAAWVRYLSFAHRFTPEDIEDIVQIAWTKIAGKARAFRQADGTDEDKENAAKGWVKKIVINTAKDYRNILRRRLSDEIQSLDGTDETGDLFEKIADPAAQHLDGRGFPIQANELQTIVPEVLEGQELQIAMAFLEAVPNKKVAEQLNLSEGRISQIRRGKVFPKIRDAWNNLLNGKPDDYDRT